MTREEKCLLAIEKGYTYNPETGNIIGPNNKILISKQKRGYSKIRLTKNTKVYELLSHQYAWYYINKECVNEIDHINGIRNDNRISNLRSVTRQQNQWNRKTKGYHFNKKLNKWHSKICINYNSIHLGYYNTEEEARNAYLQAKEKYHII